MKYLNAQQLAFILDIKKEDARAKMVAAWEKTNKLRTGSVNGATWNKKGKVVDGYPQAMPIELLSLGLNLPDLQMMVDDICNNYLKRPASKRYILFDYLEKKIKSAETAGKNPPYRIDLPAALKSMLPDEIRKQVYSLWRSNYPRKVTTP